jgi:hypothetical protein
MRFLKRLTQKFAKLETLTLENAKKIANLIEYQKKSFKRFEFLEELILNQNLQILDAKKFSKLDRRNLDRMSMRFSSQHGEDGVLIGMVDFLGIDKGRSVEIGAGNNGGCTGLLAMLRDFQAVFIEPDTNLVAELRNRFNWDNVQVLDDFATPDNIRNLIKKDVNVISCDIDSIDYWVLKEIDFAPDIVIAEYNASLGPKISATVPRDYLDLEITEELKRSQFYGCSLTALTNLFKSRDMSLIYCDISGTNAFFVNNRYKSFFQEVEPTGAYRTSSKSRLAFERGYEPDLLVKNFPWVIL